MGAIWHQKEYRYGTHGFQNIMMTPLTCWKNSFLFTFSPIQKPYFMMTWYLHTAFKQGYLYQVD